jgi:hypothetical protein
MFAQVVMILQMLMVMEHQTSVMHVQTQQLATVMETEYAMTWMYVLVVMILQMLTAMELQTSAMHVQTQQLATVMETEYAMT